MLFKAGICYFFVFVIALVAAVPRGNADSRQLRWSGKQTLTYSIMTENFHEMRLSIQGFRFVISKAFKTWSDVTSLSFKELDLDSPADIQILFQPELGGFKNESWSTNSNSSSNLIEFAYNAYWEIYTPGKPILNDTNDLYYDSLGAIGLMLGLYNSDDPKSIMNRDDYVKSISDANGNYIEPRLSRSDIENAQRLHGRPQPNTFTVFDDEYQLGDNKVFQFFNDENCHELKGFNDIASSIALNGHCLELFEDAFCEKRSVMVKPGCIDGSCCNPHTFVKCNFNDLASSYRACPNTGINIVIWISVIIVILIIGFLLIGIVFPWAFEGLKKLIKKLKRKRFAFQAYLHQPTGDKKIAISQLKFVGIIGTGNSANVRLAHFYPNLEKNTEFLDVAVKTVKLHVSFSAVQKEIEIMEECDHENILKFVGWLQEGSHTHIVTEFMHGGNLHNFLRNEKNSVKINQLFSYIMQILDAMIYLGKVHILHRDLAARNCLLNSTFETLKISDFGLSRKTDNNDEYLLQNDSELPFRWLPVESLSGKESYSVKGDVWAFGIVIWEIFERCQIPYKGMNVNGVSEFLKSGKRLPQPFYCSNQIYSIMLSCWDADPKKRPEFETLKIHFNSILNNRKPDILPDSNYDNYYETPVKIFNDKQ